MKMFLVKRKILTAAVCLLLAAGMFYVVNHPAIVGAAAAARQLPIYCVQRDQKVLSISFDAAWGNEDTQMLIDILGKYKIKATFFVVGEWVDKYPESVKALHDAGHEVMNHSNTHAHMSQLSKDEIIADVEACNDKIEAVTGVRPTLIRPPYGEYDDNVITAIRSIGMEPIQWDVDVSQTASSTSTAFVYLPPSPFCCLSTISTFFKQVPNHAQPGHFSVRLWLPILNPFLHFVFRPRPLVRTLLQPFVEQDESIPFPVEALYPVPAPSA